MTCPAGEREAECKEQRQGADQTGTHGAGKDEGNDMDDTEAGETCRPEGK